MIDAEVDRRLQAEAEHRAERERQEKELLLLEKEQVEQIFCMKDCCLLSEKSSDLDCKTERFRVPLAPYLATMLRTRSRY